MIRLTRPILSGWTHISKIVNWAATTFDQITTSLAIHLPSQPNADNTQVLHTYSWGNTANPRGWNKDQSEDVKAAQKALDAGKGLNKVGDSKLDPYVEKAFNKLNTKENEHRNLGIARNCKWESKNLLKEARELQKQEAEKQKEKLLKK